MTPQAPATCIVHISLSNKRRNRAAITFLMHMDAAPCMLRVTVLRHVYVRVLRMCIGLQPIRFTEDQTFGAFYRKLISGGWLCIQIGKTLISAHLIGV